MTAAVEHVALLVHGGVLVDANGSLPTLPGVEDGHTLAEVLALVDADIPIAPTAKLADGRLVHFVGTRADARAVGSFIVPEALPDAALAIVVARAVDELDPARTPAGRPDWFRAGWFDVLEAWLDSVLEPRGRRRTGPVEPYKVWSISAVVRVPTEHGTLWCKAPCAHFRAEPRIHAAVSDMLPALVPELVAIEATEGWVLMEPFAGAEEDEQAQGAALETARRWAAAQLATIGRVPELLAAGFPDRGLESTITAFERVLEGSAELALLSDAERLALSTAAAPAMELVRAFWGTGIPDTLAHGDLHLGNVAWDGATLRIFDWTDGCVSHPFLDASHLGRWADDDSAARALAAYADPWRARFPDADIDRALALAALADLVFQTVTYDAIMNATEPQSAWELGGMVARNLRQLPQLVAEA
ncbi:phosphotransferase [Agrococcus sp. ProA11]|uniref:phosphotransferase family protein n=1 Tax=Agrococcus chionoecetis TaxID=3153752 RepID=UPI0032611AA4